MPTGKTAFDLIRGSLRLITAIAVGETMTADEANDGLDRLNDLLEGWSTERLAVPASDNVTFTLTANQAVYSIGTSPGADFNTSRPVNISDVYVTVSGVDYSVAQIGQQDYDAISVKQSGSDITQVYTYLNSMPTGLLKIWPVPAAGSTMTLNIDTILSGVPNLQYAMNVPPAAYAALQYTLALLLAPEYEKTPSPLVSAAATKFMSDYKRTNRQRRTLKFDQALTDGPVGYAGLTAYVVGNSGQLPSPVLNVVLSP